VQTVVCHFSTTEGTVQSLTYRDCNKIAIISFKVSKINFSDQIGGNLDTKGYGIATRYLNFYCFFQHFQLRL
jgi:hypothetical protein